MSVVTTSGNSLSRVSDAIESSNLCSAVIWFRRDSDDAAADPVCEFNDNGASNSYTWARVSATDRLQAYGAGYGNTAEFGPDPLSVGDWVYVFMTKNATPVVTVKELSDGDTAFGDTVTLDTGLTELAIDEVWIGRNAVGSNVAPATIAFLKIWSGVVISDADALFERQYRNVQRNLGNEWANYQFKTGALATDSSSQGRTLTLNGTPTFSSDEPNAILGDDPPDFTGVVGGGYRYVRGSRSTVSVF